MDNKGETGPELHRLLSLFPHKLVRPTQVAALEAIARMFAEGNRLAIIEVPTGAGKSALRWLLHAMPPPSVMRNLDLAHTFSFLTTVSPCRWRGTSEIRAWLPREAGSIMDQNL